VSSSGAARRRRAAVSKAVRLFVALLPLIAACTSTNPRRFESRAPRAATPAVHVVQRGDTLFKIAWQYRVDQRDLARWNGLKNPDLIRVGQRLRLSPPRGATARPQPRPAVAPPAPRADRPPQRAPPTTTAVPTPPLQWSWPTDGGVVVRFGASDGIATGIGIRGREGQAVRAAAKGRVVYAGSGLIGYGQLVIIKHNDTYLSAYGYNSALLVAQGQEVERGTTIAYMGRGPNREPRLHFEIRRDGVPFDPLTLLVPPR